VSKTKQADGEIHEDQLLNFLVNRLDEEVSLSLANNAEITAEDIYEVLVGARVAGGVNAWVTRRRRCRARRRRAPRRDRRGPRR